MPLQPVHDAARRGDLNVLKLYVDKYPVLVNDTVKHCGFKPVHWASQCGHIHVVRHLVKHGAEIMAQTNQGETAQDLARKNGHVEIVEYLQPFIERAELKQCQADCVQLQNDLDATHAQLDQQKQAHAALQREHRKSSHEALMQVKALKGELAVVQTDLNTTGWTCLKAQNELRGKLKQTKQELAHIHKRLIAVMAAIAALVVVGAAMAAGKAPHVGAGAGNGRNIAKAARPRHSLPVKSANLPTQSRHMVKNPVAISVKNKNSATTTSASAGSSTNGRNNGGGLPWKKKSAAPKKDKNGNVLKNHWHKIESIFVDSL